MSIKFVWFIMWAVLVSFIAAMIGTAAGNLMHNANVVLPVTLIVCSLFVCFRWPYDKDTETDDDGNT